MATLDHILSQGGLVPFELPDWEVRLPIHRLFVTPGFQHWAKETPRLHDLAHGKAKRTMHEHLQQTLSDFRCSERPSAGDLKRMMPTKHGIWKLRSHGIRAYGWAPKVRTLAIVTGVLEADTKSDKSLNGAKLKEVLGFIKANKLENELIRGDIRAVFPLP